MVRPSNAVLTREQFLRFAKAAVEKGYADAAGGRRCPANQDEVCERVGLFAVPHRIIEARKIRQCYGAAFDACHAHERIRKTEPC